MSVQFCTTKKSDPLGADATAPIALPWRSLAALLVLAGTSLLLPRALLAYPRTAHSWLSNYGF